MTTNTATVYDVIHDGVPQGHVENLRRWLTHLETETEIEAATKQLVSEPHTAKLLGLVITVIKGDEAEKALKDIASKRETERVNSESALSKARTAKGKTETELAEKTTDEEAAFCRALAAAFAVNGKITGFLKEYGNGQTIKQIKLALNNNRQYISPALLAELDLVQEQRKKNNSKSS